jgi:hypothetical protein
VAPENALTLRGARRTRPQNKLLTEPAFGTGAFTIASGTCSCQRRKALDLRLRSHPELHNVQLPKGSQGSTAVASGAKRLTFVFAFTQTNLGDGFSSAYRRALPTCCGYSAPGLQRSSYQRRCVIGCAFKQGLPNGQMLRYSQSHFSSTTSSPEPPERADASNF